MINIDIDLSGFDEIFNQINEAEHKFIMKLQRIGEMYVAQGRKHKGKSGTLKDYTDRSGNLRHAHSYRLYKDGRVLYENIGSSVTGAFLDKYKTGVGIELVCGNGMEYCTYVEGKGYDVVSSGFLKAESEARKL